MATEYIISIKVQGSESASGPLGVVGGALGRIAEFVSAGVIFRGLEQIGQGLQSAASAGFNAATSFETVMSRIKGLTTTPTADIAKMSSAIITLSKTMNVSATELAEAEYFIASSGFAGKQATDILTASAKAASAGLGQTKTIADAVTSALNAYKLKAGDAARITDVLTRAVIEGKGEPAEFAGALGRVLPIASQAGVSFEQVAASMATMTRTGMSAEEAATALRGTLGALLAPGKQAQDALVAIGWSADGVREAIRDRGLNAALAEMMQRTGGNVEMLDAIIPNIRALTGVLSSAGSQGTAYAEVLDSMMKATGSVDTAFAASAGTWEFQFGRFKNVLLAMPIELGEKMLPGLTGILDAVTKDIGGKTSGWADLVAGWLGPTIGRLQVAAQTGGIQGVMAEIGKLINEGWTNSVQPQLQKWATAFWDWMTGKEGAQAQVPSTMSKLMATIQKWADAPETQAQMAAFGETASRGLVQGVEFLLGQSKTWAPIFLTVGRAMGEAAGEVGLEVGGQMAAGIVRGLVSQLTGKDVSKGGASIGIGGFRIGVAGSQPGGTNQANQTNQTIYGGVNVFGANNLQDLLASLIP